MIVEEKFAQFVSLCEGKPSKVVRLLYQQLPLSFEVQLLVSLSHDSLVALPHLMGLPTYKKGSWVQKARAYLNSSNLYP